MNEAPDREKYNFYAPPGQWRVICVEPSAKRDWIAGDRDSREEAIELARAEAHPGIVAYVYNEHGACSFNKGLRVNRKEDPYRRK